MNSEGVFLALLLLVDLIDRNGENGIRQMNSCIQGMGECVNSLNNKTTSLTATAVGITNWLKFTVIFQNQPSSTKTKKVSSMEMW